MRIQRSEFSVFMLSLDVLLNTTAEALVRAGQHAYTCVVIAKISALSRMASCGGPLGFQRRGLIEVASGCDSLGSQFREIGVELGLEEKTPATHSNWLRQLVGPAFSGPFRDVDVSASVTKWRERTFGIRRLFGAHEDSSAKHRAIGTDGS